MARAENVSRADVGELERSDPLRVIVAATAGLEPCLESSQCGPARSGHISIEVADARRFAALAGPWRTLAVRAANPNVFMEPAVVAAASETFRSKIRVLLAWPRLILICPRFFAQMT
jgi:hypothetical protein